MTTGSGSESGNVSYDFDPDCSYQVGPQKWKVGTSENTWYKDSNSTDYYFTIITQPLEAYITQPTNNQTFVKGEDDIELRGYVRDDCDLIKGAVVDFHVKKGTYDVPCSGVVDEGNGYYHCIISGSESGGWPTSYLGRWNSTMNASKVYYNSSKVYTEKDSFVLITKPVITSYSVVSNEGTSTGGWGETWQYDFTLTDDDLTISPREDRVNVSLWVNLASGWKLVNSTICTESPCSFTFIQSNDFGCVDIGTREWNITATDLYGYQDIKSSTLTVDKDDIQIIVEPSLSDSSVDREFNDVAKGYLERLRIFSLVVQSNSSRFKGLFLL